MHPMIRVSLDCIRHTHRKILQQYDRQEPSSSVNGIADFAHSMIEEELKERYPYLQCLTELAENPASEWVCIIDALSGKNNFYHKIPMFASSITFARYHQRLQSHQLEYTLIYEPLSDRLFHAERGRGAFMNQRRLRMPNHNLFLKNTGPTPILSVEADTDLSKRMLDITDVRFEMRTLGCMALSCAMTAQGQTQACIISPQDSSEIAAGSLLIQEAGGLILPLDSGSFDWMHPSPFVAGQPGLAGWIKHQITA